MTETTTETTTEKTTETTLRAKPGRKAGRQRLVEASVMLGEKERDGLDALGQAEGRTRSDLIREAIRKTYEKRLKASS